MEASSYDYSNAVVDYLENKVFELVEPELLRKEILEAIATKTREDISVAVTLQKGTLEVIAGNITFYIRKSKSEKL